MAELVKRANKGPALRECSVTIKRLSAADILKWQGNFSGHRRKKCRSGQKMDATPGTSSKALNCDRNYPSTSSSPQSLSPHEPVHSAGQTRKKCRSGQKMDATPGTSPKAQHCDQNCPSTSSAPQSLSPHEPEHSAGQRRKKCRSGQKMDATPGTSSKAQHCDQNCPSTSSAPQSLSPHEPEHSAGQTRKKCRSGQKMDATPGTSPKAQHCDQNCPSTSSAPQSLSPHEPEHSAGQRRKKCRSGQKMDATPGTSSKAQHCDQNCPSTSSAPQSLSPHEPEHSAGQTRKKCRSGQKMDATPGTSPKAQHCDQNCPSTSSAPQSLSPHEPEHSAGQRRKKCRSGQKLDATPGTSSKAQHCDQNCPSTSSSLQSSSPHEPEHSAGQTRKKCRSGQKMDATPGTSPKAQHCDQNCPSTSSSLQSLSPHEPEHSAGQRRKKCRSGQKMDATPGTSSKALHCDRNCPSTSSSLQSLSPHEPEHSAGQRRKKCRSGQKLDATPGTSPKAQHCDQNCPSTSSSLQSLSPHEPEHSAGQRRKKCRSGQKMDATPGTSSKALHCDRNCPSTSSSLQSLSPHEPEHSAGQRRKKCRSGQKMDATPGTSSKALHCDRNCPSTSSSLQSLSPHEPEHSAGQRRKKCRSGQKMDATPGTSSKALHCDRNYPSTSSSLQSLSPHEPEHSAGQRRKKCRSGQKMDATPGTSSKALHCDQNCPSTSSLLQSLSPHEPEHSAANSESVNSVSSLPSDDSAALHPSNTTPNAPSERPLHSPSSPTADQRSPRPVPRTDPSSTFEKLENNVILLKGIMKKLDVMTENRCSTGFQVSRMEPYPTLPRRTQKRKNEVDSRLNRIEENVKLNSVGTIPNQVQREENRGLLESGFGSQNEANTQKLDKGETSSKSIESQPTSTSKIRVIETYKLLANFRGVVETLPKQEQSVGVSGDISESCTQFFPNLPNPVKPDQKTLSVSRNDVVNEPTFPKKLRVIETRKLLKNPVPLSEYVGSQVAGALNNGAFFQSRPDLSVLLHGDPTLEKSRIQIPEMTQRDAAKISEFPGKENSAKPERSYPVLSCVPKPLITPIRTESDPIAVELAVPSSTGALPTPHLICCIFCYEVNVEMRDQLCKRCWLKMEKLKKDVLEGSVTAIPRCSHYNRPMRGCKACIFRAFIVRFNIRHPNSPFEFPYARMNSSIHITRQLVPRTESTGTTKPQNVTPTSSSLHGKVDSSIRATCRKSLHDSSVDLVQHASSSKKPAVSAFVAGWFQVVPKNENEPPTPFDGCCYSCYEYNDTLPFKHCERCWSEMEKLKKKFLEDSETPLPYCTHHLNRPMRGCEACVLRVFIVRFNNRHPTLPFEIPYARVISPIRVTRQLVPRIESTKTGKPVDLVQNASSSKKPAVEKPHEFTSKISNFDENWFLKISDDVNKRPTPRPNHCVSCYELNKSPVSSKYCQDCKAMADELKNKYLEDPNTIMPSCTHQLNRPMRGCKSCSLRAYIITHNESNPSEPYAIPYDEVESKCQQRDQTERGSYQTSELVITSVQTLNPPPPETPNFPKGWFQKISDDVYDLPTVRHGCCMSCYEYKTRYDNHCADCNSNAKVLEERFMKNPNTPLPQCTHQLNDPLRGCNACIIRAFIIQYNKKHPDNPYAIPYKSFDDEIPDDRLQQLQQPQIPQTPECALNLTRAGFSAFPTKADAQNGIPKYFNARAEPFPKNWFSQTSTDPNIPPTTFRGQCQSCYEFKSRNFSGPACSKCRARFKRVKWNICEKGIKIPDCDHQLNQPMRHCFGCCVKAYAHGFRRRNGYNFIDSF